MASKSLIILLCVVASVWSTYTDKYDNINYKEIMENERLLLAYVDCVMERGKCTPEGKELKGWFKVFKIEISPFGINQLGYKKFVWKQQPKH